MSLASLSERDMLRIANAAGRDAGKKSAHKARRTAWNEDNWNAAHAEVQSVLSAVGFQMEIAG